MTLLTKNGSGRTGDTAWHLLEKDLLKLLSRTFCSNFPTVFVVSFVILL